MLRQEARRKAGLRLRRHLIMTLPQNRKQTRGWGGNGTVVQLVKCWLPSIKIGNWNQDPQDLPKEPDMMCLLF